MIAIDNEEDYRSKIAEGKLVVAMFTASWCGACKQIKPKLTKLCDELGEKVVFLTVDSTEMADLAMAEGVLNLPTIIIYVSGEQKDKFVGSKWEKVETAVRQFA